MKRFKTLEDFKVKGKRILVRVDLNVPMRDGRVSDKTRITRILPTITCLTEAGARVVLISHFGRPKGKRVPDMSLAPLVSPLSEALQGSPVVFAGDCVGAVAAEAIAALGDGDVALLENLRFHPGEEANDKAFALALSELGDLFVNDAFSAAHRAHASVVGLAELLPAAAGRAMQAELDHLESALESPERPLAALVGGAKVSTKLALLGHLVTRVDHLIIGGGMANTFLHALGNDVGSSLCEKDMAETALKIVEQAKDANCDIILPSDAVVAKSLAANVETQLVSVESVPSDSAIFDAGPLTAEHITHCLASCRSLVWNGPLGCFEVPPFDQATNRVARTAAELTEQGRLLSVAGGGDTVAALAHAHVVDRFTYVSTAGGAFLEWLEGKTLPGVAALARD